MDSLERGSYSNLSLATVADAGNWRQNFEAGPLPDGRVSEKSTHETHGMKVDPVLGGHDLTVVQFQHPVRRTGDLGVVGDHDNGLPCTVQILEQG